MNRKLRNMLSVLLAVVFAGSSTTVLRQLWDYRTAEQANNKAKELIVQAISDTSCGTEQIPDNPQSDILYEEPIPEPGIPLTAEPILDESEQISVDEEPENKPILEEPEQVPVDGEPENKPILEEPEQAPVDGEPENKPILEEPEQVSVDEEPENEPETEPIPEEPEQEPLDKDVQFLLEIDLDPLRKINENVLGWIYIPDSSIDYPLMTFDDNEYGLHHAWDGTKSKSGCIFLECKSSRDFSDFHTLIYGHNMLNNTMFSGLKKYTEEKYLKEHPFVYIVTDDSVRRYEIFSVYEAGIYSDTYRLYFADEEQKQEMLTLYTESSMIKTGIIPDTEDHILTLSTCVGAGTAPVRWVVQTVLTGVFPR